MKPDVCPQSQDMSDQERRILYINHDFPPMSGPGVWRALWFLKYLHAYGHKITVICADRSHWCDRYDETLLDRLPQDVDIIRLKSLFPEDILAGGNRDPDQNGVKLLHQIKRTLFQ